jgi:hypothetical protein
LSSASARDGSDGVYYVDKTIELNFPFFQLPMVAVGEAGRHAG